MLLSEFYLTVRKSSSYETPKFKRRTQTGGPVWEEIVNYEKNLQ